LEDIKSLCNHVVENFSTTLDKITYVQTFKALRVRYDQHQDRIKDRANIEPHSSILRGPPSSRFRRDERALDEDEEMWFNEDEDELDENGGNTPVIGPVLPAAAAVVASEAKVTQSTDNTPLDRIMSQDKLKELSTNNKDNNLAKMADNNGVGGGEQPPDSSEAAVTPPPSAKRLGGPLVDYDSDSDEEGSGGENGGGNGGPEAAAAETEQPVAAAAVDEDGGLPPAKKLKADAN